MVSNNSVATQLTNLGLNKRVLNQSEFRELPNILLPNEKIFECVTGLYENGVALLVGTNIRILLIDKKPLRFLKVEDIRFDMINQIDYSHRFFEANITISTGVKTLKFKSYDKDRLRKLISHIQHRMAEVRFEFESNHSSISKNPDTKLAKYIEEHKKATQALEDDREVPVQIQLKQSQDNGINYTEQYSKPQDIYDDAMKAIFGDNYIKKKFHSYEPPTALPSTNDDIDMGSLKIAYAKLPMILRDRMLGRQVLTRSQTPKART